MVNRITKVRRGDEIKTKETYIPDELMNTINNENFYIIIIKKNGIRKF